MKKNKTVKQLNDQQRAMVVENINYADKIARTYLRKGVMLEDLEQVAREALCHAAMNFDPDKGCKLTTFATVFINGCLSRYIVRHCQHSYLTKQQRNFVKVFSLEQLYCNEDEEIGWEEKLCCDVAGEDSEEIETFEMLDFLMSQLTAEEQEIISKYAGLNGEAMTITELSAQMGISRMTMSIRCKAIMMKMAECAEKYNVER